MQLRRARAAADAGRFVVSPITGELVPIGEMAEHMRISLIDPKWKEQRELMLAKIRCARAHGPAAKKSPEP